ncbi:MAG: hypothetical protein DWQ05_20720 [Calditrichaeota bacterium]|nr:MAG: hypothetical protein DWQ05_20720 [Calditrichota bacterium]
MESPDILSICFSVLLTVFLILSSLAVTIQIITQVFSFKEPNEDTTVYAALTASHAALFPGTKITKIEELK